MNKVKLELKKRKENNLRRYQFIGAELKRSRLNLSKTLHSVSGTNRSISYISKIENNKIIPNEESLMELCNELYISRSDLDNMNKFDQSILSAIEALFYKEYNKLKDIFLIYNKFSFARTELIKGMYYVGFNKIDELKDTLIKLEAVEESLIFDDYIIYVYLKCCILYMNNEFLNAYKIAKCVISENISNKYIIALLYKILFLIKLNFGIGSYEKEYSDLKNVYFELNNFKEVEEFNIIYDAKNIEEVDLNDLDTLSFKSNSSHMENLLTLKRGNNKELKALLYKDDLSLRIKMDIYYKLNLKEELSNIILKLSNNSNDYLDYIMCNYYQIKMENDPLKLKEYLLDICVPFCLKRHCVSQAIKFYEELCTINTTISKYKESALISMELVSVIKEIISVTR